MILEDLRGYLLANSIAPVYLSFEPPSSGITLYIYPGKQADPWNPRYRYYKIQAVTRYSDFQTAQIKANQVYTVLQNLVGIVGATDVINCYANQEPYQMGYDDAQQAKFVQNFELECIVDSSVDPSGYVTIGGYTIDWANIINTPTTVSGYGITDVLSSNRNLTINGLTQNLSADRIWNVGDVYTTSGYQDPDWLQTLDYAKLVNVPPSSGTGTVTHVGFVAPAIFDVTGSPITTSGTITLDLVSQSLGTFLAAPSGIAGVPSFRAITATDLPSIPWSKIYGTPTTLAGYGITDPVVLEDRALTINGIEQDLSADRSWTVGDLFASGIYNDPTWLNTLAWSKITSTPTTLAGYGITDAVPTNRTITINGLAQDLSANRTWNVGDVFTTSAYLNPDWLVTLDYSKLTNVPPSSGMGTVTYVGLIAPDIFTVSGSPILSSGTFGLELVAQAANRVFAGPTTGGNAIPTFRALVADDIPVHSQAWSTITGTPTTLAGYGITDGVPTNRTITINGLEQDLSANRTWSVGDVFTTSSYLDPSWLSTLHWDKITNKPLLASGTVQYVGLILPGTLFTVSGSPITVSGTFSGGLVDQSINTFFAGPATGSAGTPSFRTIVLDDLPDIPFSAITETPTTLAGYGITDAYTEAEADARFAPISISGTLRYVGLALPNIFTVNNSPLTGPGGTISGVLVNQPSGLVFAGPISGADATPSFRTLVLADLPDIPFAATTDKPTTLAGYGITDAYTKVASDSRYVPSGLLPPVSMYWTSSGNIMFVAHSGGIALGAPYVAGSGYLTYAVADATNQTLFTPTTTFPIILDYNDVLRVSCSGLVIYKSATFPRIA